MTDQAGDQAKSMPIHDIPPLGAFLTPNDGGTADVECDVTGGFPLIEAAENGNIDTARLLREERAAR